ncbi:MAG: M48 family metalloprotease [Candidatus Hydrothermae bacterium]|nr:M48 family metalloprotease [Candidatus Hydrothermae bacterium]
MADIVLLVALATGLFLLASAPRLIERWGLSTTHVVALTGAAWVLLFAYPVALGSMHLHEWWLHGQHCTHHILPCSLTRTADRIGFLMPIVWGGALFLTALIRGGHMALQAFRHTRRLQRFPQTHLDRHTAVLLPVNTPILAVQGVFRPTLIASEGVLQQYTREELVSALKHEEAHIRHRHNLKGLLLTVLLSPFPGGWTRPLREAFLWVRELEADRDVPNPRALASALLKTLAPGFQGASALAEPAGPVEDRLERLLGLQPYPRTRKGLGSWFAVLFALSLLLPLLGSAHHLEQARSVTVCRTQVCAPAEAALCVPPAP